jgi:hypothetical protein
MNGNTSRFYSAREHESSRNACKRALRANDAPQGCEEWARTSDSPARQRGGDPSLALRVDLSRKHATSPEINARKRKEG